MPIRIGPETNLTGLVAYLDAKNEASYNGVGNVWYDCSGNGNNFTLQGSPSWDGTKISFNENVGGGLNQYVLCSNTTCGNFSSSSFTIEIVHNYVTASNQFSAIFSKRNSACCVSSPNLPGYHYDPQGAIHIVDSYNGTDNNANSFITTNVNGVRLTNAVSYNVFTVYRDPLDTNVVSASIWLNGVRHSDDIKYRMSGSGDINNNIPFHLYRSPSGAGGWYSTGSIYTVRMYNRLLEQSEILTNYNIYRDYYGF